MVVIVDTNVWIRQYRRNSAAVARQLIRWTERNEAAVCGPTWVEFLGGFRNDQTRRRFTERLRAYRWVDTTRAAVELAAEWLAKYPRLASIDAIIAATAYTNRAALFTFDRDLLPLKDEGLVVLLAPSE